MPDALVIVPLLIAAPLVGSYGTHYLLKAVSFCWDILLDAVDIERWNWS